LFGFAGDESLAQATAGVNFGVRLLRILSSLQVGESAVLVSLDLPPGVQNHLMYMGFVPDTRVKSLRRAPSGDPTVYLVDGIEIALRHETARAIQVRPLTVETQPAAQPEAPAQAVEELTEAVR
jgi:Fe2+ transport system protein FeoA